MAKTITSPVVIPEGKYMEQLPAGTLYRFPSPDTMPTMKIELKNISSLPITKTVTWPTIGTNNGIFLYYWYFSNPSAQQSEWIVTEDEDTNSISISGTISGTTDLILYYRGYTNGGSALTLPKLSISNDLNIGTWNGFDATDMVVKEVTFKALPTSGTSVAQTYNLTWVKSGMEVVGWRCTNPSALTSNITVTTANGRITLSYSHTSGTGIGNLTLLLVVPLVLTAT